MPTDANNIQKLITSKKDKKKAERTKRFFKTGPGEYAEHDPFLGVPNPILRKIIKENKDIPLEEIAKLLQNRWHEIRLCALLFFVEKFKHSKLLEQKKIVEYYIHGAPNYINNWDLVDLSAPGIIGQYDLTQNNWNQIQYFAARPSLWEKRIAIVATLAFIRQGHYDPTLKLTLDFMNHPHDLIHKACGWMLREVGKRNQSQLTDFLQQHKSKMPRTMLRYAIEHYPENTRRKFLQKD